MTRIAVERRTHVPIFATPAQCRLLAVIAQDMDLHQAAAELHYSYSTVRNMMIEIRKVYGTHTTAGAIIEAIRRGDIEV